MQDERLCPRTLGKICPARRKNHPVSWTRGIELGDEERGADLLKDALLDGVSDGAAPPSIFDVLKLVEAKFDADHLAAMAPVGVLYASDEVRNVSQSRQLELQTDRTAGTEPTWSCDQRDTTPSLAEIFQ